MTEVTMDGNGRIAIPEHIRRRLRMRPGDTVMLDVSDSASRDEENRHFSLWRAPSEPEDVACRQRLEHALTALAAMEPDPSATGWGGEEDATAWVENLRREGEERLARVWGEDIGLCH